MDAEREGETGVLEKRVRGDRKLVTKGSVGYFV